MASSTYIEKPSINEAEPLSSNLVVVYGKQHINLDSQGIENLIEEKTLSSISVLRITSPTPSMEEEEARDERDEILRAQEFDSGEESDCSEDNETATENEAHSQKFASDEDDGSDKDEENSRGGNSNAEERIRNKRRTKKKQKAPVVKVQKRRYRGQKARPPIMGITIEAFYPVEKARELSKEALKHAGVSTFKQTAEHDFQMFAIQNDHCYTPYTSEEQMKEMRAIKGEAERQIAAERKLPQKPVKQTPTRKPTQDVAEADKSDGTQKPKRSLELLRKQKYSDSEEISGDDESLEPFNADEDKQSEYSLSEDNDRDSDLDFDVNNRGRKRKSSLLKRSKRPFITKIQQKRAQLAQESSEESASNLSRSRARYFPPAALGAMKQSMNVATKLAAAPGQVTKTHGVAGQAPKANVVMPGQASKSPMVGVPGAKPALVSIPGAKPILIGGPAAKPTLSAGQTSKPSLITGQTLKPSLGAGQAFKPSMEAGQTTSVAGQAAKTSAQAGLASKSPATMTARTFKPFVVASQALKSPISGKISKPSVLSAQTSKPPLMIGQLTKPAVTVSADAAKHPTPANKLPAVAVQSSKPAALPTIAKKPATIASQTPKQAAVPTPPSKPAAITVQSPKPLSDKPTILSVQTFKPPGGAAPTNKPAAIDSPVNKSVVVASPVDVPQVAAFPLNKPPTTLKDLQDMKPKKVAQSESWSPGGQKQISIPPRGVAPGAAKLGSPSTPRATHIQTSPQAIKEININKVKASPKGGFTNISALLDEPTEKVAPEAPTTPTSSTRHSGQRNTPSSKGFMPLGVETADKNQLPAQISIQTHQSSSELAAERDKQLDLIDSIVKDEMKKSNRIEQAVTTNTDIPELVKMLESTEQALESQQTAYEAPTTSDNTPATKEDIEMVSAQLLDATADDIPEDLLKHVVELIEDDKTLKEAVEKQALEASAAATAVPLESVYNPPHKPQTVMNPPSKEQPVKSIIQIAISNEIGQPPSPPQSSNIEYRVSEIIVPKQSPIVPNRKEPIKIVRNNGRIITLPPMEAPTTRAKRRAQYSATANSSSTSLSESMLDSSLPLSASNTSLTTAENSLSGEISTPRARPARDESTTSATKATRKKAPKRGGNLKGRPRPDKSGTDASESQDDDDPNKLWCICRQPHNNRFMICCDSCSDWFHGTCVGVTKAMGLDMENKKIDWTCPNCKEKKQRKITEMLQMKQTPATKEVNIEPPPPLPTLPSLPVAAVKQQPTAPAEATEPVPKEMYEPLEAAATMPMTSTPKQKLTVHAKNIAKAAPMDSPGAPAAVKSPTVPTSAQRKLYPAMLIVNKSKPPQTKSAAVHNKTHPQAAKAPKVPVAMTPCLVCKRHVRGDSIYCSDECIRKYTLNVVNTCSTKTSENVTNSPGKPFAAEEKKKSKGLFEDVLSLVDRKPKVERLQVLERKTGRLLTGNNAPTTSNLKKWLQENPTFEVVLPGSKQAIEIEKQQKARENFNKSGLNSLITKHFSPVSTPGKSSPSSSPSTITPQKSEPLPATKETAIPEKPEQQPQKTAPVKPHSSTPLKKHPDQVAIKPDKKPEPKDDHKPKDKAVKRQNSDASKRKSTGESSANTSNNSEDLRTVVQRTLTEHLQARVNELAGDGNAAKLSAAEIEEFVTNTEAEMYSMFNHDIGVKYKAKYRSLMFNIKDKKNTTLITKICEGLIDPTQLVRMTADELASTELAQWREKETKHQLDIITKSELDALTCTNSYVLKTHKGEEVIETKTAEYSNVEDVVSALHSQMEEAEAHAPPPPRRDYALLSDFDISLVPNPDGHEPVVRVIQKFAEDKPKAVSKEKEKTAEVEKLKIAQKTEQKPVDKAKEKEKEKIRDKEKERARDKEREREREREKRHKSKEHHKDKSRSHKHSRSRSRSGSRSREKKHKTSHKDERRDREKEKDREERHREKEKKPEADKQHAEKKVPKEEKPRELATPIAKKSAPTVVPQTFSLIDQILGSSKTIEEAANIVQPSSSAAATPAKITPVTPTAAPTTPSTPVQKPPEDEDNVEEFSPSSNSEDPYNKYLKTEHGRPNIWSGNINMIDVASFQITLQPVMGNTQKLGELLPTRSLDVVGRIEPGTVWDYISKIKKGPNKKIVLVRFVPANEYETAAYSILFQYLDKRNRLGVIKTTSNEIKDFYICPLRSGKHLPTILQPAERVDFLENLNQRPDMLIGVIVRIIMKRSANTAASALNPTTKLHKHSQLRETSMFTPPGSPKRKKHLPKTDDMDIDAIIKAPISKIQKTKPPTLPVAIVDDADEPYSPGDGSDEDLPLLPAAAPPTARQNEELDELNRRIAASEIEIAGLFETARYAAPSQAQANVLANISIPSNLSQILASITSRPPLPATAPVTNLDPRTAAYTNTAAFDEEYNPETPSHTSYTHEEAPSRSRLAQLSEAELLSMVPDNMIDAPRYEEPPPPGV